MFTRTKSTVALHRDDSPPSACPSSRRSPTQPPSPPAHAPPTSSPRTKDGIYIFHVKVVQRELDAVNYFNRSGATKIGFRGTELMPGAHGDAKVNAVTGKTNIEVQLRRPHPGQRLRP